MRAASVGIEGGQKLALKPALALDLWGYMAMFRILFWSERIFPSPKKAFYKLWE
jgi:hypothetical protein